MTDRAKGAKKKKREKERRRSVERQLAALLDFKGMPVSTSKYTNE